MESASSRRSWVGCSGISDLMTANGLALTPVLIAGTEEQKKEFVAPFARDLMDASFCLTEPGAGSDAGGIATTAKKDGDGYLLNGRKCFITNGSYASQYTVFASTDRSKGHKGLSAFVVPRSHPGVSPGKKEDKMGQRASDTSDVLLEDVRVPAANLLGKEGDGFKIAMKTLDYARPTVAAMSVGGAGGVRARDEVLEGAGAVRDTDRDEPGDPLPAGRHGDGHRGRRGCSPSKAPGCSTRAGAHEGVLLCEGVRRGPGDARDHRCGPGLRGIRLHEGLPGGEADARREAPPDLRGPARSSAW
jgi:hypothetical protein